MSYSPQFWVSGAIHKARETRYMFYMYDKKLIIFALYGRFHEHCPQFWVSSAIHKARETRYMLERYDRTLVIFAF